MSHQTGPRRRWDLWGCAAGIAIGAVDAGIFLFFGADLTLAGRDVTIPVLGLFELAYGALGFAVGRLAMARAQAREDADTIERQLRALEDSQRAALQNEKLAAIGRLAAGIAHEVRNPLGVIRSSAAMVQESFAPGDEPWRACEFIREETVRLDALTSKLLDFARPRPLRLQSSSLEKAVLHALQLAQPELESRRIQVSQTGIREAPELEADPDLLAQLVLDLVVNAAEAAGEGGRVALRAQGLRGDLVLEVADSGPGVPVVSAEQIFEPFFTTKPRGTGLGLAMVARIVQAHGGSISVAIGRGEGPGGAGACFRSSLPLHGPAERRRSGSAERSA
ncbi:MAG TPA: ATP-binding protein [Myxococcota bacterium]|jgi:two-component system sensor histidine kinase HydH